MLPPLHQASGVTFGAPIYCLTMMQLADYLSFDEMRHDGKLGRAYIQ